MKIIIDYHWFMNDEKAIDWKEGFQDFHWTRRTRSRKGDGRWARRPHTYQGGSYVFLGRRRKMSV
jgi:hypothetical protein